MRRYRKKPDIVRAIQLGRTLWKDMQDFFDEDRPPVFANGDLAIGGARATELDWIVREMDGGLTVYTPDNFQASYEEVTDAEARPEGKPAQEEEAAG